MFGAHSQGIEVYRQALYEQVWSTPMTKLAEKYRISDVGFAKICKRLNVPYPGRGYWRKMEKGNGESSQTASTSTEFGSHQRVRNHLSESTI